MPPAAEVGEPAFSTHSAGAADDLVAQVGGDAAERALRAHQSHRHHVVEVDREAAVDLGELRQIGDLPDIESIVIDRAGERFDRSALRPLPPERFVYTEWRQARVNIDYHVDVNRHYYSVPHRLVHQLLDLRVDVDDLPQHLDLLRAIAQHPAARARGLKADEHHRIPAVG